MHIDQKKFFLFQYKLCKVRKTQLGPKNVPFLVTHDGRTIRYPDPIIKANDTIQLDIATGKITDHIKFDSGECGKCRKVRMKKRVPVKEKEKYSDRVDIRILAFCSVIELSSSSQFFHVENFSSKFYLSKISSSSCPLRKF